MEVVYLLLFDKPIICSYGEMHLWTFYPLSMRRLGGMHNLVLRLSVHPYLGLAEKVDSPPICFLIYAKVGFCQLGLFYLTGCIPNTLAFC